MYKFFKMFMFHSNLENKVENEIEHQKCADIVICENGYHTKRIVAIKFAHRRG